MDDIKLYASTQTQMKGLLRIVEEITSDIRMEFGIDKCKMLNIEKGKWKNELNIETLNNEILNNMQKDETYKYLGFRQNTRIEHTKIKCHLTEEYKKRLSLLLKTKLNSKNLFRAINSYAIPILTYSFGIIKWSQTDLEQLNILTRAQLTKYRKLHPNSCKERLSIQRRDGGRGLIDFLILHSKQLQSLQNYFHSKDTPLHLAVTKADRQYTPLNLSEREQIQGNIQTQQQKIEQWSQKKLHGKHQNIMNNEEISKPDSYHWLHAGQLFPETEGFLLAIQDQVIATRNYQKYILKNVEINDKCRKCHQQSETIDHIVGGCKILVGTEYTERHNTVAKIIHQALALKCHLLSAQTPYYNYKPDNVLENEQFKLYYDLTLHTDKTILHNRPDITFQDKGKRTTYLIDISVPIDTNIVKKYNEKIEKYTPLAIEIERVWKQDRVIIIPFVISATGITPKSFKKHLTELQLDTHLHQHVQKATILKTCNITRTFLRQ